MTDYKEVRTTEHEQGREQRFATFKATQVIWLLLGLIEAVLALRVIFKLIGVNASNSFAAFLYNLTGVFVAPFASLTGTPAVGNVVFEFSTIIAMIVYLLIFWAIERIVYVAFYRPRGPVSVRQTSVSDHAAPMGTTQTTTTDHTVGGAPVGTSQTTVTERTSNRPPGSL